MHKFWFLVILIAGVLLPMRYVQAQPEVTIDSLEIDLWPEFDRPEMLVIYRIKLSSDVRLPLTMSLYIPADAGDPYNVAVTEADGMLYNTVYTRTVQGDLAKITFTATTPDIQFEYYDPSLKKSGTDRSYVYNWHGEATVNSLSVQVQQPVGASAMQITPDLGAGIEGEGGLVYYTGLLGSVQAGDEFSISVMYQKPTGDLSSASMNVEPISTLDTRAPGRVLNDQNLLLVGTMLLVLVVVISGLWFYTSARREEPKAVEPKRLTRPAADAAEDTTPIYCSQCGRRANKGDLFCRACGTPLRRP